MGSRLETLVVSVFLTMNVLNANELFKTVEVVKGIPAFIIYFTIECFNYVKM